MNYNKSKTSKINEKKIMRKVKKNWVVLSLSLFGVISVGNVVNNDYVAHADTQSSTTQSNALHTNNTTNSGAIDSAITNSASSLSSDNTSATQSSVSSYAAASSANSLPQLSSTNNSTVTSPNQTSDSDAVVNGFLVDSNPASSAYIYITAQTKSIGNISNTSSSVSFGDTISVIGNKTVYPQKVDLNNDPITDTKVYDAFNNDSEGNSPIASISTPEISYNGQIQPISSNDYNVVNDHNYSDDTPQFYDDLNTGNDTSYIAFNNDILTNNKVSFNIGDNINYNYQINLNPNFSGVGFNDNNGNYQVGLTPVGRFHRVVTAIPSIKVNYVDDNNVPIKNTQYLSPNDNNTIGVGKSFSVDVPRIDGYSYEKYSTSSNYQLNSSGYAEPLLIDSGEDGSNLNVNDGKINGTFNDVRTSSDNTTNTDIVARDWMTNDITLVYKNDSSKVVNSSSPTSNSAVPSHSSTPVISSVASSASSSSATSSPSSKSITSSATSNKPVVSSSSDNTSSAASQSLSPAFSSETTSYQYTTSPSVSSNAPFLYYSASSSSTSISTSTASSSSTSSASAATSAVNNKRKMYNHKTQLVKQNGKVKIYIEPKYAANDANGALANHYVVTRHSSNGSVKHNQILTLEQYNAMLTASGKQTFTQDRLNQTYSKRKYVQGIVRDKVNKTTFDAKPVKQGNDTLIDTNGDNYGFDQSNDKQMVLDTDDLRVPVHSTKIKKHHKIIVKSHHHSKDMKHMKMVNHMNRKHKSK